MFSALRRSSLPFAATALISLLAGCAASKALEASDNARSPSGAPANEDSTYAQGPATKGESAPQASEDSAAEASPQASPETAPAAARGRGEFDDREGGAAKSASAKSRRSVQERPGLGTTWGENRSSPIHEVSFVRDSSADPWALFRIQYNDESGLLAQTGEDSLNAFTSNYTQSPNRFISVEVVDSNGSSLPGLVTSDRTYVLGHHGDRYAIRITNHERQRFEVVATVDGLDVIDGSKGSFGKRGYVLNGFDTLLIEGFRRSNREVAAFRFGSVKDSYSAQSGKGDRNVGVIGVAVFGERQREPVYTRREIELRETAEPFPSRYARPPAAHIAD